MILEPGMKLLVAHRRLFASDHLRYFSGVVDGYQDGVARVTGTSWMRDGYTGAYEAKPGGCTKLIALASGTVIVYQLPSSIELGDLAFHKDKERLILGDGKGFVMDLTEARMQVSGEKFEEPEERRIA